MTDAAKVGVASVTAPPQPQRTLIRKVAEILGELGRVPKRGHNSFHNYDYALEADIVEAVRLGMSKRALALIPDVEKVEWGQLGKSRLCTLTVAFTLEDGESGETRVIHVMGEGTDQGDKSSYKAMTGAEKYALMKLFLVSTGDDPERDDGAAHSQPQQGVGQTQRQPQAKPQETKGQQTTDAQRKAAQEAATHLVATEAKKALRARFAAVWAKAREVTTKEKFGAWCEKIIGSKKPSANWTAEEMTKVETSMAEFIAKITAPA